MANEKVGVNLKEGVGLSPIEGVSTAVSALIGNFERGPLNQATLVTSMAQFQSIFGNVPALGSTAWYSVKGFFKKVGSGSLYIVRVASSAAAKGFVNFTDGSVNTVKVEALYEGTWGNNLSAKVEAYSILSTTPAVDISASATEGTLVSVEGLEVGSDFKFYNGTNTEYRRLTNVDQAAKKIYWNTGLTNAYTTANGVLTSMEFKLSIYENGVLVETHNGLGVNSATSFFLEKKIVSSYIAGTFIKAVPDNDYQDLPTASGPTTLASGADGLADVDEADYSGDQSTKTGVYALDAIENLFRFCCPNPLLTDADVPAAYQTLIQNLTTYADNRVTVQFYADIRYGTSIANAVTWAGNFSSRRLCVWFPWLKVVESSIVKWLPPSAFAMACAVKKDYTRGIYKNVGNETIPYVIDLEYHVSVGEGETLNDAGINTIRYFSGRGIRTYGGRTRSAVVAFRFINYSEYWNYVGKSLEVACQNVPFEPHNELLWKTVTRRITAFLANEHRIGALFDASDPTGIPYSVVMDSTNNPQDQIALGIANVKVEYVPVGVAEKFVIELTSSPAGLSFK